MASTVIIDGTDVVAAASAVVIDVVDASPDMSGSQTAVALDDQFIGLTVVTLRLPIHNN